MNTMIFVHIPKCGGRIFQEVFRRQFRPDTLLEVGSMKGKVSPADFKAMCEESFLECAGFTGHYSFGLHVFMRYPSRYVAFLREPVARYLSQYSDLLMKGEGVLRGHLRRDGLDASALEAMRHVPLESFLSSPFAESFANIQTRYMAGLTDNQTPDRNSLLRAKKNLTDLAALGLAERFDESLLLMSYELGWSRIFYRRLDTSRKQFRVEATPEISARILALNHLDDELYDHAGEIFATRLQKYAARIAGELEPFQKLNRRFQYLPEGLVKRIPIGVLRFFAKGRPSE